MTARLLPITLMLASCFVVLGCGQLPGRPKPGPEVPRPDAVTDFATLYGQNCSACHGAQGMNGPSYPLANPEYQALVNEQLLQKAVAEGAPGTLMPAFAISSGGSLTDQQVDALVKGMRTAWYKPAATEEASLPPYHAATIADTSRGAQVYAAYCASCHGVAGQPGKTKAGSITEPAFLSLIGDQALRTVIIAGRPDIGQPDWRNAMPGHPMTDQQITDVVGWLSSQRKPRGGTQ